MSAYPPSPWRLRGQLYLSVWLVPAAALRPLPPELAATHHPVVLGGRAVVGAAWVRYGPGGVLEYRELLSAVLVRAGARPAASIVDIWVDSDASLAGGRELWGIPKRRAAFGFIPDPPAAALDLTAHDGDGPLAAASVDVGRGLPLRLPFRFPVVQARSGHPLATPVRGSTRARLARSRWQPEPSGRLGYLAGRRPLLTLALTDFRMTVGR
ncbi:acetoacetate decarboxylase family protein [Rhizomonospora bruguierae]|uniref:acetoacetate decarboxylase family protein n=1 Tax=Rhizomonospora bruguierae TaxID=1581705 RepID=UPI001BD181A7|nr:acetoacetate decarboxylase family protein [Micromonospora sp. NBRC 107566]